MKVSQLIHTMDKDDVIVIDDYEAPIDKMTIYEGPVKGISRDNPINKMHIESVCAHGSRMLVLAVNPKERESGLQKDTSIALNAERR